MLSGTIKSKNLDSDNYVFLIGKVVGLLDYLGSLLEYRERLYVTVFAWKL